MSVSGGIAANLGGGNLTLQSTNYAMSAADSVVVVVGNIAAVTITLPPNPVAGRQVLITNAASSAFAITVNTSDGKQIFGAATSSIGAGGAGSMFIFSGIAWAFVSTN